jgi:predicted phage-related endonuclease
MNLGLTEEQIESRRLGVGGSDAKRVMDGDWLALWREKTGRSKPEDLSGNLAVQMGTCTEPLNALWYERQTGRSVVWRNRLAVHPTIPFLRANMDGLTKTTKGDLAYVDFKHCGRLDDATVLRYTPQGVHCAQIAAAELKTPVDWWCLSVFIGNSKWELVEQPIDPFYAETYLAKAAEFWEYVVTDQEPPEQIAAVAAPKPAPKLRIIQLEDDFRSEWPNWAGEMLPLIDTFASTKPAADLHAITRDSIKALVPEDVGSVTRGLFKFNRDKAGAVRMSLVREKV